MRRTPKLLFQTSSCENIASQLAHYHWFPILKSNIYLLTFLGRCKTLNRIHTMRNWKTRGKVPPSSMHYLDRKIWSHHYSSVIVQVSNLHVGPWSLMSCWLWFLVRKIHINCCYEYLFICHILSLCAGIVRSKMNWRPKLPESFWRNMRQHAYIHKCVRMYVYVNLIFTYYFSRSYWFLIKPYTPTHVYMYVNCHRRLMVVQICLCTWYSSPHYNDHPDGKMT